MSFSAFNPLPQPITVSLPSHTHFSPSVSLGQTYSASAVTMTGIGSGALNGMHINTTSNYSVKFENMSGNEKGSMRFDTNKGNIEVHDGTEWTIVCGLDDDQRKSQQIINVLLNDYPEIAADLVLRGIID